LTIDILAYCNAMPRSVAKAESGGAPNILARRENNEQGLAGFPSNLGAELEDGLLTCHLERRILLPSTPAKRQTGILAAAYEACSIQICQGFFP
jgi:hypothetical protein